MTIVHFGKLANDTTSMILLLLLFHWYALLRLDNTTLRQSYQIETQL